MEVEEFRQDLPLDLTMADAHGQVWHFDKPDCRANLFYCLAHQCAPGSAHTSK